MRLAIFNLGKKRFTSSYLNIAHVSVCQLRVETNKGKFKMFEIFRVQMDVSGKIFEAVHKQKILDKQYLRKNDKKLLNFYVNNILLM